MSLPRLVPTALALAVLLTGCGRTGGTLGFAAPDPTVNMVQEVDAPPAGADPDVPSVKLVSTGSVPDELIVATEPGVRALLATSDDAPKPVRDFTMGLRYQTVKLPKGMTREEAMKKLKAQAGVKLVALNRRYGTTMVPNDARYKDQWGMHDDRANAEAAWDRHVDASNVKVAVLGTGVDYNHPELRGRVIIGPDLADHDNDPMDKHGHGTHVSGIIGAAGNDGQGVAGVAWNCKILAIKVLSDNGGGNTDAVAEGTRLAADQGARVINLSLGTGDAELDPVVHAAMIYARDRNCVIVAAAGNDAGAVSSPANDPVAIAVSSTSSFWVFEWLSLFSNYGDKIEVAAPGGGILSTLPVNGGTAGKLYGKLSGTSMAAPFVAGEAALIVAQHPNWTADQVRARIRTAVVDKGNKGRDTKYGYGRIDLARALD
jgi:thermitase